MKQGTPIRALTVVPGRSGSAAWLDRAEPVGSGSVLARTLAIGICGTDHEILAGQYGWSPGDSDRLVIGHESLLEVIDAPSDSGFAIGDHIVGIVRRPDPVPCRCCAADEWDMCLNGRYTERGIKELDGYAATHVRIEPAFATAVDRSLGILGVLLEPASVVAKAWDHIERIGQRSRSWEPRTVLVTGAGPVGLLAAMMGRQRGLQVHVHDHAKKGRKPKLVRDLGAAYSHDPAALSTLSPDIVIECTGASTLVVDAMQHTAPAGIVCLAGISSGTRPVALDMAQLNRQMVLENDVVFGSVNANRLHYELAAKALALADPDWLSRMITRRVPIADWVEAFEQRPDDVKVILDFEH